MSNVFQVDQDLWMKALHFHGPLLLQTVLSEVSDSRGEAESDKLSMCKFIKNKLHLLFKPCENPSDSLADHSVPIVPIELFQNSSNLERRDLFFKSLDRGNILILRVINDALPDNFKLLVLCKPEICMKLDDLSIIMYLPKLPAELELAEGKLQSNDLIRAAVCSCSIDERKLYVTLDSTVLEDEAAENVKLGKIEDTDLPFYLSDIDFGSSYVEYLHHTPEFSNPSCAEELYTVLNLKKKYRYSFMDSLDGKKYPPEEFGAELKKKQILTLSNEQHAKGLGYYNTGKFKDAFICFNSALSIYPKNIEALVSRGILYANTNNLRKAFVDMEEALKVDPKHIGARSQMSVLLVSAARLHIERDDLDKANESLDAALNLDSNNKDAIVALEEIRQKIVTTTDKLDKPPKPEKKNRIRSSSSDSSSSKKDSSTKEKQESFLEASTRAFLSSMQKKFVEHSKEKKKHHSHHSHHKSRSKSPKRQS